MRVRISALSWLICLYDWDFDLATETSTIWNLFNWIDVNACAFIHKQINCLCVLEHSFSYAVWYSQSQRFDIQACHMILELDMLLIRQTDGTVKNDWYQNPKACNRTLNFHSQHTLKQKTAVIYGMFHRILSLIDYEFKDKSISRIVNILRESSYPLDIIMKQLRRFNASVNTQNDLIDINNNDDTPIIRRPYTYCPSVSDNIQKSILFR